MADRWKRVSEGFVSHRFAVFVIAALFFASLAGWIAQELVPLDFVERRSVYAEAWRPGLARTVEILRLYDPFHSPWYRFFLALFLAVLIACNASRIRRIAARSRDVRPPASTRELRGRGPRFEVSWRSLAGGERGGTDVLTYHGERFGRSETVEPSALGGLFARAASLLKRRGLRVESLREDDSIRFAASSGRLRSPGTMLFHVGVAVIAIGGLLGSLLGWRGMIYLSKGESTPFPPDSAATLRVDDFRIVTGGRGEIRAYISRITILDDGGDRLAEGSIEVNRPFNFRGVRIYQSSFLIGEDEFAWARVSYRTRGIAAYRTLTLVPGEAAALGDEARTISAIRFIPDFRMGPEGAFSASPDPANPALEIEVSGAGETRRGWLFLHHPQFASRFGDGLDLTLERIEPVYYTGLEFGANPGAPVLFAGFAAATLGLMLMYLCNPRVIKGIVTREGLLIAGVSYRWKASFDREFEAIVEAIRREFDESG